MAAIVCCLTSFNRPRLLLRAVKSVLAQTFTDLECWVLDDGSTPSNIHTIETLLAKLDDDRIKLVKFRTTDQTRQEACRYAVTINWCLENSHSRYVHYLPDDDYLYPDAYERFVSALDEGHKAVYGAQSLRNGDDEEIGFRRALGQIDQGMPAYCVLDHSQLAHRRDILDEIGLWPTEVEHWRKADGMFMNKITERWTIVPVDYPDRPVSAKRYAETCLDSKVRAGKAAWDGPWQ